MTSSSASTKTAPSLKKLFKSLGGLMKSRVYMTSSSASTNRPKPEEVVQVTWGAYEIKSLHDQF